MQSRGKLVLIVVSLLFFSPLAHSAKNECKLSILSKPSGIISSGLKQKKIPNLMTDYYSKEELSEFRNQEKTISKNTHASNRAISRSQIYPAPYISKKLEAIGAKLLKKWPGKNPDYKIYITTTLYYGPLTSEDGAILVPVGFLERAQSEDEIAFVLAHELGHLLFLHAREAAATTGIKATLRNMNQRFGGLLEFSKSLQNDKGELFMDQEQQKEMDRLKGRAFTYYEHARSLTTEFIHPVRRKKHEDEADLLAVELLLKSGYSLEGIAQAFENMRATQNAACLELKRFAQSLQDFTKNELQTAVDSFASQNTVYDLKGQLIQGAKNLSRKKIEKALQQQALPKTHRPYEKRLKYAFKFAERDQLEDFFDAADETEPKLGALKSIKASSEYKQLLASALAATEVVGALEKGDIKLAKTNLSKVNMQTQYGRILKYRIRKQEGKQSSAVENLSIALRSEKPALEVFQKSLAYRLSANELTQANTLLGRAENQFRDSVHFLPERIYITQKKTANKNGETQKLLTACLEAGRDYMEGPCYAAATAISPNFREEYKTILKLVDCKASKDTGGDVICHGDNPYKPKGIALPKIPSFTSKE